jgi:hypothetical protein
MLRKLPTPLLPSSSSESSWRIQIHLTPHHRRGREGDKPPIPRNLVWRDLNTKKYDLLEKKLIREMDLHSPLSG